MYAYIKCAKCGNIFHEIPFVQCVPTVMLACSSLKSGASEKQVCEKSICKDCWETHFRRILWKHIYADGNQAHDVFAPTAPIDSSLIAMLPKEEQCSAATNNARRRPTYTCPHCGEVIHKPPTRNWLAYAATVKLSERHRRIERPLHPHKSVYKWTDFFPESRYSFAVDSR